MNFERHAARHLELQRETLTRAWLEEIGRDAPTGELPERIPAALARMAQLLRDGDDAAFAADPAVVEGVRALERLRREQDVGEREVLRRLHLLARLLDAACLEWLGSFAGAPEPASVLRTTGRLNRAPLLMAEFCAGAAEGPQGVEAAETARWEDDFTRTLVHQLRTPLNAAELAALILEDDEMVHSAQERRRFAVLIQRSLRRVSTVIDDAWRLAANGDADRLPGRQLPFPQLLSQVLTETREMTLEARVRLEVQEPAPDWRVDASRLEAILLNLIGNAARYCDPDRDVRWVHVRFGDEGGERWVEVSDNGLGIPQEHQRRIFERFFRAHPEHAEGTGLGLSIAHEAARQLGGRIELQSTPGVGSTFRVVLPAHDPDTETQ